MMTLLALAACEMPSGWVGALGEAEDVPEAVLNLAPAISDFLCEPSSGPAPLESTCRWAVRDPEGTAIGCGLDLDGDGTIDRELEDCRATSSLGHVFTAVGLHRVRLLARDSGGRSAEALFELNAGNTPPSIDVFAAAKLSGTAPLTTTLSWELSDANADPLSCALDADGDGVSELDLEPCTSGAQPWTFASGSHEVWLTVTDAHGGVSRRSLSVAAVEPIGDLRIARVEWGQTVVGSNLRLVEGKPALLRVHVLADRPAISGVEVLARFTRQGSLLGEQLLTGPATPPTAEDDADLGKSFRATLPPEWVGPGLEVTLSIDPADRLPETDELNNERTLTPDVGKGNVLRVTAVPVVYGGATGAVPAYGDHLWQMWPLKEVEGQTRAPFTFTGDFTDALGGWSDLLGQVGALRAADGSSRYYYGFVRSGSWGIAGLGFIGSPIAVGLENAVDVMAHELGHNFGLPHAPCGGASGALASFPYPDAKIGSWGYDLVSESLLNPSYYVDLMSYCRPQWVSDFYYNRVQTFLEAAAYGSGGGSPAAPMLLLSGRIDGDRVELRPVQRIHSWPTPPQRGEHTLRLVGAEGVVEHPFEVQRAAEGETEHFTVVLPDPGALREIEVTRAGRVLHRAVAAAPRPSPAVQLSEREGRLVVRWEAALFPHALVAHLGEERTTLGLWLTGGEAALELGALPAGGRFEVSLSDGLNAVRLELPRP